MSRNPLIANSLRFLAMDAIQNANSGHPGAPLGMAEMATALWTGHLRHNPKNPRFFNRDRFVLSNGHASMLMYALLHLSGYDLSLDELKRFRQMGSKTPGHPEYGVTPGIDAGTGPLGQGIGNAVGMALAEKILAARFNKDGFKVIDHRTYCFLGDGCMMEGVSHEACSLAGALGLGKLIALYDSNGISIDGAVEPWFCEDVAKRFQAYGWETIGPIDGNDVEAVDAALSQAEADDSKPTLIVCRTKIGAGAATMAGSAKTHGSPLGAEEIRRTRDALGWTLPPFELPKEAYAAFDASAKGEKLEKDWNGLMERYERAYPELAKELKRRIAGELPEALDAALSEAFRQIEEKRETIATRKASQNALTVLASAMPELIGGSADLTPSNLTKWPDAVSYAKDKPNANYVSYGVREFGMTAAVNGMALHGGVRPYGATFLMFSDYARNGLRMAAMMGVNPFFVFTHDSIGVGEDGPTHQPVEQLSSLRMIPNMSVWRPCDSFETLVAYECVVKRKDGPACLVLSRQGLPAVERSDSQKVNARKGGYVLRAEQGARAVIVATGSEVALALQAQRELAKDGVPVNVVSMPSCDVFDAQSREYRESVLPRRLPALAVEAASRDWWRKYVGLDGEVIGMEGYGLSAPGGALFEHFGFTVRNVCVKLKLMLARAGERSQGVEPD